MNVVADTVVTIEYTLFDVDGEMIEKSDEPVAYLHGGYGGIFPKVENALAGKGVGESIVVMLEPDDAFGEYDAEMVKVEERSKLPKDIEVGMQIEALITNEEGDEDMVIFTITDIEDGKVVLDGNHPLAGERLRFESRVITVREATPEEVTHGHAHGEHGHHH